MVSLIASAVPVSVYSAEEFVSASTFKDGGLNRNFAGDTSPFEGVYRDGFQWFYGKNDSPVCEPLNGLLLDLPIGNGLADDVSVILSVQGERIKDSVSVPEREFLRCEDWIEAAAISVTISANEQFWRTTDKCLCSAVLDDFGDDLIDEYLQRVC